MQKVKYRTLQEYFDSLPPERKARIDALKEKYRLRRELNEQGGDTVGSLKSGLSPS